MEASALQTIVAELLRRPGHEKVRKLLTDLLQHGLGAHSVEITYEERLPVVRGRLDALWGYTVFEVKTNLKAEREEAERKLRDYIEEKQRQTGSRHIGVATDGAEFLAFELLDGALHQLQRFVPSAAEPDALVRWLDSVVCLSPEMPPMPHLVRAQLGRESMAWLVSRSDLQAIWERLRDTAEVKLKRSLWAEHLARVYGSSIDQDELFFQHTYLSIIAKTIAVRVLGLPVPSPQELLDGQPFVQSGILGAVEADLFDWLLGDTEGNVLVRKISVQTGRFRLDEVEADVLKSLYESLIDPATRRDLGEYYTPDWLAQMMVDHQIDEPLDQRVLDPSCGSGTFLFHAIRRLVREALSANMSPAETIRLCTEKVFGIDIHPVAVQIARVTYLLAIGPELLKQRQRMAVPVYLGDALQWNTQFLVGNVDVAIHVPGENLDLKFPEGITKDPTLLDDVVSTMADLSERLAEPTAFAAWIRSKPGLDPQDGNVLQQTYTDLLRLNRQGKNHIWGFVARNLVRPLWLSQTKERPDIIIGNPPWLRYSFMSADMQKQFKRECEAKKIWEGGKVATAQDLSAYFLARCWELYGKPTGQLAFVMPYAVLNRQAYKGFRKGFFSAASIRRDGDPYVSVKFAEVWAFPETVQPLFPVPACVLFCTTHPAFEETGRRPEIIAEAAGQLPRRDACIEEAKAVLAWTQKPWPEGDSEDASPYRELFKNGATIFPRMLATVRTVESGRLGSDPKAPLVESRRTTLEKKPWRDLEPLRGNVEREFLRPLYLGESIAPFRALASVLSVIPWEERKRRLLSARTALQAGYVHLADWLSKAEKLWNLHKGTKSKLDFVDQLNYFGKLSAQFPIAPLRVVYSASGSLIASSLLSDPDGVIEHKLYGMNVETSEEGRYLTAILNSTTVKQQIERRQSRGQWGARDVDKIVFSLPIPRFDPNEPLHAELAKLSERAEQVAHSVSLPERTRFIKARFLIRKAIAESGLAKEIDSAVTKLLNVGS